MSHSLNFAADRSAMKLDAGAGFCGGRSEKVEDDEYEYVDEEIEVEEEIQVEIEAEVEHVAEAGETSKEVEEAMEKSNEDGDNVEQMETEVEDVVGEAKWRRLCEVLTGSGHLDGSFISPLALNPQPSSANTGRSSYTGIIPSSSSPVVGLCIEGRSPSQNTEKTKERVLESAGASANDPQAQASKSKSKKSSKDVHEGSTEERKRFKAAVAEFCKKVIYPAWHSGQLSSDAFRSPPNKG